MTTTVDYYSSTDAASLLERYDVILESLEKGDAVQIYFELERLGNPTTFYLAQRMRLALHGLGLNTLPGTWVRPTSHGLRFDTLSVRQADQLVIALEDIANGRRSHLARTSADQLTLF